MRKLLRVVSAQEAHDGDGVKISRIGGQALNGFLDPFLLLDEINSDDAADYIGGFPEHPHRGFETITYMKAGRMRHRDHMGNEGIIHPGDVQWMTAGKGVIHSEMPEQEAGLLHGFQLWLNLPAAEKMQPAAYQGIHSANMPALKTRSGSTVTAIAGTVSAEGNTIVGPLPDRTTRPVLLDVELRGHAKLDLRFSATNDALVYVYRGSTDQLDSKQLGIYSNGQTLPLVAADSGAGLLVLSGQQIGEPIVQHGPFVMNHHSEIIDAVRDYQSNQFV